jgi:hypothetical protein
VALNAETEAMMPPAGLQKAANWKAAPVSGSAVNLPWANVKVNPDSSGEAQNEPYVAINPANAKHLVVGANSWQSGTGQFEVFAYVSFDGGQTWTASQPYINRSASRLNAADATVIFGSDGAVYMGFVAFSPAEGAVAVSRSTDGGLTWSQQSWATSLTGPGADKPVLAMANGSLHVFWQGSALYSRVSNDRGATWGTTNTIEAGGRYAAPVVTGKTVNVVYTVGNTIRLARSANNGSTYSAQTVTTATALQARPTHYRAAIIPSAAADAAGNIYVAWADGRNAGSGNDILLTRVGAATEAIAPVVRVNDDASAADQLMPSVTVGADGQVNVAWLDNRDDAANYNYNIYMARSANGLSFGANNRVSNVTSNPDNDARLQGSMIGDYIGVAASNGTVYTFWTDTRNTNEDIYLAPVALPTGK